MAYGCATGHYCRVEIDCLGKKSLGSDAVRSKIWGHEVDTGSDVDWKPCDKCCSVELIQEYTRYIYISYSIRVDTDTYLQKPSFLVEVNDS